MGRKSKNTIQKSVNMHPSLMKEVRAYAKTRTEEEIEKEKSEEFINNQKTK